MAMWREIAAFARPVLGSEILRRIASQMDVIMLGRFSGAGTLGQYRNGFRLAAQPAQAFVDVGAYVLLPTLAHISGERRRLGSVVRRVYGVALAGAVPVSLAMIPLGVPIAVLFLGPEWRPAGHAIAALWGLLLGGMVSSVAAESSKAVGRPGLLVRIHTVNLVVTAVLVIATAIPFGLIGVASAVSASQVLVGLYAFGLLAPARRHDVARVGRRGGLAVRCRRRDAGGDGGLRGPRRIRSTTARRSASCSPGCRCSSAGWSTLARSASSTLAARPTSWRRAAGSGARRGWVRPPSPDRRTGGRRRPR